MRSSLETFLLDSGLCREGKIFVYDKNETTFWIYTNGLFKQSDIPLHIRNEVVSGTSSIFFLQKDSVKLVFYIFRIKFEADDFVILLQDEPNRDYLNLFISKILEKLSYYRLDNSQNLKEVEFLREELTECENEVNTLYEKKTSLEEYVSKNSADIESLELSVSVLRNSRKKMLKLIDGLEMPLLSVDMHYDVVNVNKAVGQFAGEDNLPRFVGSKCYKVIYNKDRVCEWCKFDDVVADKKSYNQHIHLEKHGNSYVYEHILYPIFDEKHDVVEVGEYLHDITENYSLVKSLEESNVKIQRFSKDRINSMNEISSVKKDYEELLNSYEDAQLKIKKLSSALEKILEQNVVNEMLKLRSENKELKTKIDKYSEIIKNYKLLNENNKARTDELLKRSVYSVDRLTNILSNKKNISDDDLKNTLSFITSQIEQIKNKLQEE